MIMLVSQKDDILTTYFVISFWNAAFEIRRYSKGYVKPADSGFTLGSVTWLQSKKFLLLHILQISLKCINECRLKIRVLGQRRPKLEPSGWLTTLYLSWVLLSLDKPLHSVVSGFFLLK